MKKKLLLVAILLLIVTGCGKEVNKLENNNINNSVVQNYENVNWGTIEPIKFMSNGMELTINFYGTYSYVTKSNLTEDEVRNTFVNGLNGYINSLSDIDYYNITSSIDKNELLSNVNNNNYIIFSDVTITGKLTQESLEKINSY
jgi:hypothetical protein